MILHTHDLTEVNEDGGERLVAVYVLHATPADIRELADALNASLEANPEVESFSITLGRVEDLTPTEVVVSPPSELLVPKFYER